MTTTRVVRKTAERTMLTFAVWPAVRVDEGFHDDTLLVFETFVRMSSPSKGVSADGSPYPAPSPRSTARPTARLDERQRP